MHSSFFLSKTPSASDGWENGSILGVTEEEEREGGGRKDSKESNLQTAAAALCRHRLLLI